MKTHGIGLIILLIAFAISAYPTIINYKWIANPPKNADEIKAMYSELTLVTLIGLVTNILAIVGILVFLVEFRKHEHSHEHEVSTPRPVPLPP